MVASHLLAHVHCYNYYFSPINIIIMNTDEVFLTSVLLPLLLCYISMSWATECSLSSFSVSPSHPHLSLPLPLSLSNQPVEAVGRQSRVCSMFLPAKRATLAGVTNLCFMRLTVCWAQSQTQVTTQQYVLCRH